MEQALALSVAQPRFDTMLLVLFAGIALDGAVLQLDDDANKSVYGKKSVAADLAVRKVSAAAMGVVQPFLGALQKYASAEAPKTTRK